MISSLTASVNGLVTLASTAINERDTQKLAATRAELTQKVIEVQSKVLSQVGMISDMLTEREELKERIRELEQQLRYRESYRLVSVGTGFCYEFKQVADVTEGSEAEASHFVCQPCLDVRRQKVVLTFSRGRYDCSECKASVRV